MNQAYDIVYLTAEGLQQIEDELEYLKTTRREEIALKLETAIRQGDLKENADYHDAKDEQGFVAGRIRDLDRACREAHKTDCKGPNGDGLVGFGIHLLRRFSMKKTILLSVLIFTVLIYMIPESSFSLAENDTQIRVPLRFDQYYTLDQVFEALKVLNEAYPDLTTLDIAGKSEEGRPIYVMTLNNPKTGKAQDKPGIWTDGNIHGNEIQGGEICLYTNTMITVEKLGG